MLSYLQDTIALDAGLRLGYPSGLEEENSVALAVAGQCKQLQGGQKCAYLQMLIAQIAVPELGY